MKHKDSWNSINEWKSVIKAYLTRFFMLILFWIPLKQNYIMINNHGRKGFCCNPKYLASALRNQYGDSIKIFWVSEYPESCYELEQMKIPVIRANSWEHIRRYFVSKVYITNDSFPHWARHRRKQLWINTWHGAINYKHIGYDYFPAMSALQRKLLLLKNRKPDVFVSGSRFFLENTAAAFGFPTEIFLCCGLPRNDLLFQPHEQLIHTILQRLGIPSGYKLALYAPTFRDDGHTSTHGMDFLMLQTTLQKRWKGKWKILFRNHSFVAEAEKDMENAVDVSDYPDMQELLLASDVLISDYSSCMWDFSLLERPCFVYAPDFDDYRSFERDFAYPPEKWPYPIAETNEELTANIMEYDEKKYLEKVMKHHKDAGRLDNGTATKQLLEKMKLMR